MQSLSKQVCYSKNFHVYFRLHGETITGKTQEKRVVMTMMIVDRVALALAIIGGLNWGLIGLFRLDLVAFLFGGQTALLSRIVYTLVGLAAIWCISLLFRNEDDVVVDNNENPHL